MLRITVFFWISDAFIPLISASSNKKIIYAYRVIFRNFNVFRLK